MFTSAYLARYLAGTQATPRSVGGSLSNWPRDHPLSQEDLTQPSLALSQCYIVSILRFYSTQIQHVPADTETLSQPQYKIITMYRNRKGSLSFSFGRLVSNAIPNFASDRVGYVELTPQRQDMFYSYQISTPDPIILGRNAFYVAGCTDAERRSTQIHRALQKNGVLNADGKVDTTKIGPKFIHQLAFVDQMSQKNLINLLFFWEEEVHRLNKLSSEEDELTSMIDAATASADDENGDTETLDQMKFSRERVRMKKRQLPSQRRADMELDQDTTVQDAFKAQPNAPRYTNEGETANVEVPPSYYSQPQPSARHGSVA